jgi:hypothetical protein
VCCCARTCPDRSRTRLAVDSGCLTGPALGKGKVIVDTISSAWSNVRAGLSDLAVKLNEICEEVITHVVFDGGACHHEDYRARRLVPAEECLVLVGRGSALCRAAGGHAHQRCVR